MAAPSQIPNHQQIEVVDSDGDAFPSACTFNLLNLCSNFSQALAFDFNINGARTFPPEKLNEWIVEYGSSGRWQIALKHRASGRYLAATSPKWSSPMWLTDMPQLWHVYAGAQPNTFWLATLQSPDSFLHTWDQKNASGADVGLMTNRDPDAGTFNVPYANFEETTTGMSWRLEGTHEYQMWKYGRKTAEMGQLKQDLDKREQALAAREQQCQQDEARAKKAREDGNAQAQKTPGDQATKKKADELAAREAKVAAPEERVKQSKKAGPADVLKSEQEKKKLAEANKDHVDANQKLQDELLSLRQENADLRSRQTITPGGAGPLNAPGLYAATPGVLEKDAVPPPVKVLPPMTKPREVRPPMTRPRETKLSLTKPPEVRPPMTKPREVRPDIAVVVVPPLSSLATLAPAEQPAVDVPTKAKVITGVEAENRPAIIKPATAVA